MGKSRKKQKEKCCEKYKKSGKHCKDCPLFEECQLIDRSKK